MRFDRATISLVPRSTSNCLDLAVMFFGRHLRPILALWAAVSIPVIALVYGLSHYALFDLRVALALIFLASSPLGVLLVGGAAASAFGEKFAFRGLLRRMGLKGLKLLAKGLSLRAIAGSLPFGCFFSDNGFLVFVGLVLCLYPGYWLGVRTGFFVEKSVLASVSRSLHGRRTSDLVKQELGDLFLRSCWIVTFCGLLWLVLFVTVDSACNLLLGFPIWMNRAPDSLFGFDFDYLFSLWWDDPRVLSAAVATALFVYPIGRLAWLFCYVDMRVRRELWDIELLFVEEAKRLEGAR